MFQLLSHRTLSSISLEKLLKQCINVSLVRICSAYDAYEPIHHLCNIAASLSDLGSKDTASFFTITPNIVPSLANPPYPSISSFRSASQSIVHHFAFFSSSSEQISEKGNGFLKERKIYSVIARDSRMEAVTNVFRWHGRYDLAMNICSERKYLCALYYCAQGARGVLRSYAKSIRE